MAPLFPVLLHSVNQPGAVVAAPAAVAAPAPAPVPAAQNQQPQQGMMFMAPRQAGLGKRLADLPAIDPQSVANGQLHTTPEQFADRSQKLHAEINEDRSYRDAGITSAYNQGTLKVFDRHAASPDEPVLVRSLRSRKWYSDSKVES